MQSDEFEKPVLVNDKLIADFFAGKLDDDLAIVVADHLEANPQLLAAADFGAADTFLDKLRKIDQSSTDNVTPVQPASAQSEEAKIVSIVSSVPETLASYADYQIAKELGRGGMGVVYLAKNIALDRLEVLKVLSERLVSNPDARARFLREIRSVSKLNHPSIVISYSVLPLDSILAFAMEFVDGLDLHTFIVRNRQLPILVALNIAKQIAAGLQHAFEKGLVHRDIKPSNVMVCKLDEKIHTKILDFGLAKATSEELSDGLTKEGVFLGTAEYMAPEQTLNPSAADIRADIYSLGCTLYHMLTGKPPFRGTVGEILLAHSRDLAVPINLLRPDVSIELVAVIERAMAKEPNKRFQRPIEFVKALDGILRNSNRRQSSSTQTKLPDVSQTSNVSSDEVIRVQISKPTPNTFTIRKYLNPGAVLAVVGSLIVIVLAMLTPLVRRTVESHSSPAGSHTLVPIEANIEPSMENSLGMKFKLVRPGEFWMGSPIDEPERSVDEVRHRVRITEPFYMGCYEVTKEEYRRFVEESGYTVSDAWLKPGFAQDEDHPVVNVSWNDAQAFISWLNNRENASYRLPSEAEWEFACRGGSTHAELDEPVLVSEIFGNFRGEQDGYANTAPVGKLSPNALGLYDMLGNAREWVNDWYSNRAYIQQSAENPLGPEVGWTRVHRGGGWNAVSNDQRITSRRSDTPSERAFTRGFRIARDIQNVSHLNQLGNSDSRLDKPSRESTAQLRRRSSWPGEEITQFIDRGRFDDAKDRFLRLETAAKDYEAAIAVAKQQLLAAFDLTIETQRSAESVDEAILKDMRWQRTLFDNDGLIPFGSSLREASRMFLGAVQSATNKTVASIQSIKQNSPSEAVAERKHLDECLSLLSIPRVVGLWRGKIPVLKGVANKRDEFQWTLFADGTFSDDYYLGQFNATPNYRWAITDNGMTLTQQKKGPWDDVCDIFASGRRLTGVNPDHYFIEASLIDPEGLELEGGKDLAPPIRYHTFAIRGDVDDHTFRISERGFESVANRFGWPTITVNEKDWSTNTKRFLPMTEIGETPPLNFAGTKIDFLKISVFATPTYNIQDDEVTIHLDDRPAGTAKYDMRIAVPLLSDLSKATTQANVSWLQPWNIVCYGFDRSAHGLPPTLSKVVKQSPMFRTTLDHLDLYAWNKDGPQRKYLPDLPNDFYVLTAERRFRVPEGWYRLETISNDGLMVRIDDKIVVSDWKASISNQVVAEFPLANGEHTISVDYFEWDQISQLSVYFRRLR